MTVSTALVVACTPAPPAKTAAADSAPASPAAAPSQPAGQSPRSLDEWAVALKGKKPDDVIALLGRPDQAEDKKMEDSNLIAWTIFKYYGLAGNKYTGKGETLSIAFQAGVGQVRMLKQGDGAEITVPMNDE